MKVKELVSELTKCDQELEVLSFSDDQDLVLQKHLFRILEIARIGVAVGERHRGDDLIPTLKFVRSPKSEKIVLIKLLAIF